MVKSKTLVCSYLCFFFFKMVIKPQNWRWTIKNNNTWIHSPEYIHIRGTCLFHLLGGLKSAKEDHFSLHSKQGQTWVQGVCIHIYIYSTHSKKNKHSFVHLLMVFAVFCAYFGVLNLGLYIYTYTHNIYILYHIIINPYCWGFPVLGSSHEHRQKPPAGAFHAFGGFQWLTPARRSWRSYSQWAPSLVMNGVVTPLNGLSRV